MKFLFFWPKGFFSALINKEIYKTVFSKVLILDHFERAIISLLLKIVQQFFLTGRYFEMVLSKCVIICVLV